MSGGKNYEPASVSYDLKGVEIGTICGTVIAFILVIFFVFYCRRLDSRRRKSSSDHEEDDNGPNAPEAVYPSERETDSIKSRQRSASIVEQHPMDDSKDHVIDCTELKPLGHRRQEHPSKRVSILATDADSAAVAPPQSLYRKAGSEIVHENIDLEACCRDSMPRDANFSEPESAVKRLSGVLSRISWRAGKRSCK